jgi:hypothetical protein
VRRAALLLAAAPFVLGGCLGVETTPEKSAEKAKLAVDSIKDQKGLSITSVNRTVRVAQSTVVQDANGVAAVLRLENTGATQVQVPVGVTVFDAKGKQLYVNDTPGLDKSLTSLPVLAAGEETYWVNNQILVAGKASKAQGAIGTATGKAPGALPKIALTGIAVGRDEEGVYAKGTIRNESAIAQKRLVVSCVARDGDKVIAAGRAVVDALAPAADSKKPTTFTVFFIGDPKQAKLACSAPPTVLSGGTK